MGNRLSKIYTRTGDAGTTGLGDGKRVSKNSLRIHALGEVDETNAIIGLLLCEELPEDVRTLLTNVQHDLFDLGGEVCIPGMSMITDKQVTHLEEELDRFNDDLEPLKDFILPGGTRAVRVTPYHVPLPCAAAPSATLVALALEEVGERRTAPVPQPPVRPDSSCSDRVTQPRGRTRRRAVAETQERMMVRS